MPDNEFLTQDIDILPDVLPEDTEWTTEILPDAPVEPEVHTEPIIPTTEWTTVPTEVDSELDALLAGVTSSAENIDTNLDTATETITEVKEKVEEVQWSPETSDDMLKEIYQDLLKTETALQATEIAKDVAIAKVSELQAQVSELEINAAGQYSTDNPDLMIINKLLSAAEGWSDVATPKVKDALNKIYLTLFNTSIEDWQVQDNLEWLDTSWVSLNEWTLPAGEIIKEEEPTDINDITSILG